jgi:putative endonuclease
MPQASVAGAPRSAQYHRRAAAERHGRLAEHVAVLALMLRGYRVLARRHLTAAGEIDIVAVRGQRITFLEVKQRASWDEADIAVRARQTARLHRAADQWVAGRPYYRDHERGFDSLLVVPWSWPDYRRDALQPV